MKRITQNNTLLAMLRKNWVTPRDAYEQCGILRFSARILELKRSGHHMAEHWLHTQNGARVKAFKLA